MMGDTASMLGPRGLCEVGRALAGGLTHGRTSAFHRRPRPRSADFKGQLKTRDGNYRLSSPWRISHTRYLLACRAENFCSTCVRARPCDKKRSILTLARDRREGRIAAEVQLVMQILSYGISLEPP